MSDTLWDLSGAYTLGKKTDSTSASKNEATHFTRAPYAGDNTDLDMTDFLVLMVEQFKNQTIDNTASTADMMNQLVQMSVMQTVTNVSDAVKTLTDANTMSYAASLVGKEVTLGKFNSEGKLEETVGLVTATGTYNGQQVVFVDGESHYLNEIMAVGRLPEQPEKPDEGGKDETGDKPDSGGDQTDKASL